MDEKTATLNSTLKSLGLKINRNRTKVLRLKTNNRPFTVGDEELKDGDSFFYLEGTINKEGGIEKVLKTDTESPPSPLRAQEDMVQYDHQGKDKDKNLQLKCESQRILRSGDMPNTSETTALSATHA
ncbi:hypothetical protein ElyMa_001612200 [Elysia marginata]|uniref:Uncharacterized protein n=1 Tax=Elysia marginata TaxID=1093978 RepID=A0AAV4JHH3_9GAST|nr:hypothetical protein ElyMa_001612200 [Elysia marginata]